jgi:hypothetical protein
LVVTAFLALSAAGLAGCAPKVGDHCAQNTDCGTSGNLLCDSSLPNGYCTQFNCTPNICQNSAACVAFGVNAGGCPYDDYFAPSRTTRTFCMAQCHSNSDCRQSEGYVCDDPRQPPWNAAIIDDNQSERVCIPAQSSSTVLLPTLEGGLPEGSVCAASGPMFSIEGGSSTVDGASDGAESSIGDGSEAALESAADGAEDVSVDAPAESSSESDAGLADAPDGG